MRIKTLLILLLAVAFWSCSKSSGDDDLPKVDPATFSLEGLHDVALITDSLKSDTAISLTVVRDSGKAEEITLSVGALPAGVQATFSPAKGVPPFSTKLLLKKISSTTQGTYPVTISAKSASLSISGTINLTIPELNGWTFDGIDHEQFSMVMINNQGPVGSGWGFEPDLRDAYNSKSKYVFGFGVGQPYLADGVYSYKIINYDKGQLYETGEISFLCRNTDSTGGSSYVSVPSATRYAILKVTGRKYSITVPPTEMYENGDTTGPMKILTVNAWMR